MDSSELWPFNNNHYMPSLVSVGSSAWIYAMILVLIMLARLKACMICKSRRMMIKTESTILVISSHPKKVRLWKPKTLISLCLMMNVAKNM